MIVACIKVQVQAGVEVAVGFAIADGNTRAGGHGVACASGTVHVKAGGALIGVDQLSTYVAAVRHAEQRTVHVTFEVSGGDFFFDRPVFVQDVAVDFLGQVVNGAQ